MNHEKERGSGRTDRCVAVGVKHSAIDWLALVFSVRPEPHSFTNSAGHPDNAMSVPIGSVCGRAVSPKRAPRPVWQPVPSPFPKSPAVPFLGTQLRSQDERLSHGATRVSRRVTGGAGPSRGETGRAPPPRSYLNSSGISVFHTEKRPPCNGRFATRFFSQWWGCSAE